MASDSQPQDRAAIRKLIERQFRAVNWSTDHPADWKTFAGDFLPAATLFPAARPPEPQTVPDFVERMQALPEADLQTFDQSFRGAKIMVFGNVAVAFGVCENVENRQAQTRGIEAFLLVKDGDAWRIAAQAWDMERDGLSVPEEFLE